MDKMEQSSVPLGQSFEQKFPLPSWERVRVRGRCGSLAPSPHSSPLRQAQCGESSRTTVEGEEVSKSTNPLFPPPVSPRGLRLAPVVLIIFSLVFAGFVRIAAAAEGNRFLVSYGGTAGYQLPLWVNKEFGFSKKHGVDLEIILIQAGSPNIQALLGGSLQLTQTAASSSVIAAARGAPVVIVATLENKLPMLLVSRPEIKEPQQLRGKVIGINRFGGSNDAAVLMAIKSWKMDPKDITMLQTGGTAARMAALLSKKVDATVQSYPEIYQARKLGMNVLADIGDFGFYTNTSNIVTRSYLQQNRAAIKGFIKGQIEGMHYVKTNKEGSLKILRKHLQITDPEAVEGTYEFFAKRLARSPRTELEGIKNILVSIDATDKNPADFIDMSIIDEIEREGFIKKLYGS
jgi:NitT/TauT family transport system substrate-binding protein